GPTVEYIRGIVGVGNIKTSQALKDLVASRAIGKDHQIEIPVIKIQRKAEGILRNAGPEKSTIEVVCGDDAVSVDICPPEIAGPGIRLDQFTVAVSVSVDLRLVLEYTV